MKRKKVIIFLSFILIVAVCLSGCGKKKNVGASEDNAVVEEVETKDTFLFGYSCVDMANPYYDTLGKVVAETVKENGHQLLVKDAQNNSDTQIEQIKWMIEQEIDAIILVPVDREAITPALELLNDAKVKIINIDTQVKEKEMIDAYVGSDNRQAGALCGKNLLQRFPNGGKVLILESTTINSMNERILGFEEVIANDGFEVVGRIDTVSDVDISAKEMKKMLSQNKDIDAIMCGNDRMALGALKAVKQLKLKNIVIYGIDGSPEVKQELTRKGSSIVATAGQSIFAIGRTAVNVGIKSLNREKYEEETYEETFLITAENVALYGVDGWN